jgi:hypothetical protein
MGSAPGFGFYRFTAVDSRNQVCSIWRSDLSALPSDGVNCHGWAATIPPVVGTR